MNEEFQKGKRQVVMVICLSLLAILLLEFYSFLQSEWFTSNIIRFVLTLILYVFLYNVSLVNTENLTTTEFDPQLAVVFDIRLRSANGKGKSPNVSQNRVNWTSTMADRILLLGNGGVLGSSKFMPRMGANPYRDRAKSFYQRYVTKDTAGRDGLWEFC